MCSYHQQMQENFGKVMKLVSGALGALVLLTSTGAAYADEDEAASDDSDAEGIASDDEAASDDESSDEGTDEAAPKDEAPSDEGAGATTSAAGGDGGRFRFGVAAGAGPMSADGISMTYYGVDLRFGWQLDDNLGVVATPQLGYYKLDGTNGVFAAGGLTGTSVDVDYTFFDRLFVGGGLGYAILNNPSGTELHLRAGGYPLVSRSDEKIRRKGLMLGLDFRMHFVEGYTFIAPTFNIGYESF
jgi:hypothetical protein